MDKKKLEQAREERRLLAEVGVEHVTLDPEGQNSVRLHLHPAFKKGPAILYINGQTLLPVAYGKAILLRVFMQELKKMYQPGEESSEAGMEKVLHSVQERMMGLFPEVKAVGTFISDLGWLQELIFAVARGEWPEELEQYKMSMEEYAPFMTAPFRMDLAVMPMRIGGTWVCNNGCPACYANAGTVMQVAEDQMLSTEEWKKVLYILWEAGTSQVSFTGGEATERSDLVELILYAQEFTTRLNTNGRNLTAELCCQLVRALLDVAQITVYATDAQVHNALVGRSEEDALGETLAGIRNALDAGLEVSVNIPLVEMNVGLLSKTVEDLSAMGVRYFTCSGLLPAGGAKKMLATGRAVTQEALFEALSEAMQTAARLNVELDFTSPGVLDEAQLQSLGLRIPICGACLGNMAIGPDGSVLPCQSWVHERVLGNILETPWPEIWNSPACQQIRQSAANKNVCSLAEVQS